MARLRKAPSKTSQAQSAACVSNNTSDKEKPATALGSITGSSTNRRTNRTETIVIYDSEEEANKQSHSEDEVGKRDELGYLDLSAEESDMEDSENDDYGQDEEKEEHDTTNDLDFALQRESFVEKAVSKVEKAIESVASNSKKKRTMRPLGVNRVNTLVQSRRVSVREESRYNEYLSDDENVSAGSGDYEKENDEKGLFNETKRSARRKSRLSEARRRSGRSMRKPSLTPQYLSEGDGEGLSGDDEEFDSLDDFIVGDDEDISYFESAGEEVDESEDEITVKPRTPGRRLLRGRKPSLPRENDNTRKNTKVNAYIGVNTGSAHDNSDLDGLAEILNHTSLSKPESQPSDAISRKAQRPLTGRSYKPKAMDFDDDNNGTPVAASPARKTQDTSKDKKAVVFVTPPTTPSKPRLQSPKKTPSRIPPSPYRPSIDAFWSHDIISSWNDKFKPSQTPRKGLSDFKIFSDDEDDGNVDENSPPSSPEKLPPRSPKKGKESPIKSIAAIKKNQKREFDSKKISLADDFFKELDDIVTGGEIQKLAAAAGGVKIIWSKKLNTTAGRASWKREYVKGKHRVVQEASSCLAAGSDSQDSESNTSPNELVPHASYKHHASIELADKVVDSEDRLLNTLAHEYCHLANYMISNIRDQPHGASFKAWAQKCKRALKDHPVYGGRIEITTKHSYAINFKYIWSCVGCAHEYGRHSKSIDPEKSRCGKCKGMLVQIQPKPRKAAAKKEEGKPRTGLMPLSGEADTVVKSMGRFQLNG